MKSAQGFLAAIHWVLMRPIRETKSHSRLMRALAGASIRASLQTPCTQNMYGPMRSPQDLLSTALDLPTSKRPLDVPTVFAAPAHGATSATERRLLRASAARRMRSGVCAPLRAA